MKMILLLILLVKAVLLVSIDLNLPASAIHNATNNLNLVYITPSSMSMNPAIGKSGLETSATYLFNLEDLPKYNVHFVYLFNKWLLHFGNSYLAHEFYKENNAMIGVNYCYKSFTIGTNLRFVNTDVEGFNNSRTVLFDSGLMWNQGPVSTAFAIRNVTQSGFDSIIFPVVFLWESCCKVTDKGRFSFGLEKEDDFDFSLKASGSYDLFPILTLLTSYQYEPDRIGFGLVFKVAKLKLIYSVRTHQYIGLTHYISINYEIFN